MVSILADPHLGVCFAYILRSRPSLVAFDEEPSLFTHIEYAEDDSDSDYVDQQDEDMSDMSDDDDDDTESLAETEDEPEDSAVVLYSDITPNEAPILLAHLQSSHMTRDQYLPLAPEGSLVLRAKGGAAEPTDQTRQNCVICMTEPRVIICWPCRCLSLCDDCRGSLAARSSASKHSCPTCRQT